MPKILSLASLCCTILIFPPVQAQVHISGALSGVLTDTTYIADSTITVLEGDSLIIQAGAVIRFVTGDFDIYGYLYAEGEPDDSIYFRRADGSSGWGGIDFYEESDPNCLLAICRITGSTASGIDCFNAGPLISRCNIVDNEAGSSGGGIYCNSGSSAYITDCIIVDNSAFIGGGIYSSGSEVVVEGCIISRNFSPRYGGAVCVSGGATTHFLDCEIEDNTMENSSTAAYGGAFYITDANPVIENCALRGNIAGLTAPGLGGGIYCTYSDPQISGCLIEHNTAGEGDLGDGGGIYLMVSNPLLRDCLVANNSTPGGGGGVFMEFSTPTIENCTIVDNIAGSNGGGIFSSCEDFSLKNTIVEGNRGSGGIYFHIESDAAISYCDFSANENGNFSGEIPPGLGLITGYNYHGDPCDQFYNIFLNPRFIDPAQENYHPSAYSPCIDAGDPLSPLDPDSTATDIGAFYFHQVFPPAEIQLIPYGIPIQIPSGGGTFDYNLSVFNYGYSWILIDVWTKVTLPSGMLYGPLFLTVGREFAPVSSATRNFEQVVPANAPPGTYTFHAYLGTYPYLLWHQDSFEFEKLEGIDVSR